MKKKKKGLLSISSRAALLTVFGIIPLSSCGSSDRGSTPEITPNVSQSSPIATPLTSPSISPTVQVPAAIQSPSPNILNSSVFKLSNEPVPAPKWLKEKSLTTPVRNQSKWGQPLSYFPKEPPKFIRDKKLALIVEDILKLLASKSFSTKNISITIVDANTKEFADYQAETPHFPASVAKMFWLAALQGQVHNGMWNNPDTFTPFITKMMKESDNDSSSFIIDQITDTQTSKTNVSPEQLKAWLAKREFYTNSFFEQAGYRNINLTQKTYPIPYLDLTEPKGNELQVRGASQVPIRNRITAMDAARLMYEICYTKQSIDPTLSEKMCGFLKKDIDPKSWKSIKKEDFNPIETFFGESLSYKTTEFYSKAGWTPKSRQEVAMIRMKDRKKDYILVVFADDQKYGNDKTIFPAISKLVDQSLRKSK
jgi:Beta-lactamase enzyme family